MSAKIEFLLYNINIAKVRKETVLVVVLFFLLNPYITVFVMAIYGIGIKGGRNISPERNRYLVTFCVLCVIFISLINSTKVPENDLWWYVDRYKVASSMPLHKYVLIASTQSAKESLKEPMYGVFVWTLNRLFEGNVWLFKFTISFVEYSFFLVSIVLFGKKLKIAFSNIVFGVFMMCFFPYIFTTSLHLIRQYLATCLLYFVIVRISFYKKYDWWAILISIMVHSSSVLFLPILLLPAYNRPFSKAKMWYVGILAGLVVLPIIAGYLFDTGGFSSTDTIGYALNRATSSNDQNLQTAVSKYIMDGMVLLFCFCMFFSKYADNHCGIRRFSFIFIFLTSFIFISYLQSKLQLVGRYTTYVIPVLPFIFMIIFNSIKMERIVMHFICFILILFFSFSLYNGGWTYEVDMAGLFTPVFSYLPL